MGQSKGWFRKRQQFVELGPAYDSVPTRGYENEVVERLAAILLKLPGRTIERDPRFSRAVSDETSDSEFVLAVTDAARDAFADATPQNLRDAVSLWVRDGVFQTPDWRELSLDDHVVFVNELAQLAVRARRESLHLYCYYSM